MLNKPKANKRLTPFWLSCFGVLVCALFACEAKKPSTSIPQKTEVQSGKKFARPKAVLSDKSPFGKKSTGKSSFAAEGKAKLTDNISLSRATAANRARASLGTQLVEAGVIMKNAPLPTRIQVSFKQDGDNIIAKAVYRP